MAQWNLVAPYLLRVVAPALEASDRLQVLASPAKGYAVNLKQVTVRHEGVVAKALDMVDLSIAEGEHLAIIGTSGAGKSTLFNLLAGEISAKNGNVRVLPARLLTQRTELFKDSLRNNLKLAKSDASDAELNAALEAAGLGDFMKAQTEGLDAVLGEGTWALWWSGQTPSFGPAVPDRRSFMVL